MAAQARRTSANLKGLQLHFVQIDDFTALAETALHEHARQSFFGLMRQREINFPEIRAGLENRDGVEEAFGLAVDLGDDFGARGSHGVAFERALQSQFLAGEEFFLETNDAAVAADEQRFGGFLHGDSVVAEPGGFHLEAQAYAIALTDSFGAHSSIHWELTMNSA